MCVNFGLFKKYIFCKIFCCLDGILLTLSDSKWLICAYFDTESGKNHDEKKQTIYQYHQKIFDENYGANTL